MVYDLSWSWLDLVFLFTDLVLDSNTRYKRYEDYIKFGIDFYIGIDLDSKLLRDYCKGMKRESIRVLV